MSANEGFALHALAAQDITEIWEYIAAENPLAARRVREDILSAIRALVQFPHQGFRRPDLTSRPLRFTVARRYLIAYAPDEEPLWIVAVMHGRRSPASWPPSCVAGPHRPHPACAQLISQATPYRSTSAPNRAAQKVFRSGIFTIPFSASAWKTRSASSASSIPSRTWNPAGRSYCSAGMSAPANTFPPTISVAWQIFSRHARGTSFAIGELPHGSMVSILPPRHRS